MQLNQLESMAVILLKDGYSMCVGKMVEFVQKQIRPLNVKKSAVEQVAGVLNSRNKKFKKPVVTRLPYSGLSRSDSSTPISPRASS